MYAHQCELPFAPSFVGKFGFDLMDKSTFKKLKNNRECFVLTCGWIMTVASLGDGSWNRHSAADFGLQKDHRGSVGPDYTTQLWAMTMTKDPSNKWVALSKGGGGIYLFRLVSDSGKKVSTNLKKRWTSTLDRTTSYCTWSRYESYQPSLRWK